MARRKFWRKSKGPIEIGERSPVAEGLVEEMPRAQTVEFDPFNPPDASRSFQSAKAEVKPAPQGGPEARPSQGPEHQAQGQTPAPGVGPDVVPVEVGAERESKSAARSSRPVDLFIEPEVVQLSGKELRGASRAERRKKRARAVPVESGVPEESQAFHEGALVEQSETPEEPGELEKETPSVRAPSSEAVQFRRQANARAERRARLKIGGAVLVAALMVSGSVLGSIWLQGRTSEPEVTPQVPVASSSAGESLVITLMEGDKAVGIALISTHPTLEDKVVLLPPSLLVILPGYGRFELSEAIEFGGPELVALAVTNLTGARIDHAARASVSSLSKAVAGVSLEISQAVIVEDGDDQLVVVSEGVAVRDAEHLRLILGELGVSDVLSLLVRQQLVWQALLEFQRSDSTSLDRALVGAQGDRAGALRVLQLVAADESARVTSVGVTAVDSLGGDSQTYKLGVSDAEAFVASQVPYLAIVAGERPRVEILNGTPTPGVAPGIAARLVEKGFRVVRSDNADHFRYLETRVIGHTAENQGPALRVGEILGVSEIRLEQRQPSAIVDVTIIVGQDMT
jgi:hypothetical protein